jgi:hypothetical protein
MATLTDGNGPTTGDHRHRLSATPTLTAMRLPTSPARGRDLGQRLAVLTASVVGAGLVAGVLYLFNPAEYGFYPRCLLHTTTGLNCPGCGALRAAHQLLHGHFRAAFVLNPLLVVLSPLFVWMSVAFLVRTLAGQTLKHPFAHRWWMWALLAVVIGFGLCRNLPFAALTWLAP